MVRLFQVYYPVRTLVLLAGEATIVCFSFLGASLIRFGPDSYIVLNYEDGVLKILIATFIVVICSYYFDLYAPQQLASPEEMYFRLLLVLGTSSFVLAGTVYCFPGFRFGRHVYLTGLTILTFSLSLWRTAYVWVISHPYLRERVYVLGSGERATRLVEALRARKDLGMEVVGWLGALGNGTSEPVGLPSGLQGVLLRTPIDRLVIAVSDRRSALPMRELLELRMNGTKIEEANSLLEKVSGKIEIDGLYPSSLIYSEGFRLNTRSLLMRRVISVVIAAGVSLLCLPLIPLIMIAVKLSSPGSVLFQQQRVGLRGKTFNLYKFRTMRPDAEAETGAIWAGKNDPRVTRVGRFLRGSRLDEIPQLWNVIRGDMGFVGPRPERPEFVQWLTEKIPYYRMRHIIRPGITGWSQVRFRYGASLEDAQEKLQYELYYIKHMSLSLDFFIIFETVKTILLRRGAQ